MQTKILFVLASLVICLCLLIGFSIPRSRKKADSFKGPVLVNNLSNSDFDFKLELFFSNETGVRAFSIDKTHITEQGSDFLRYNHGVLPSDKYELFLHNINEYRKEHDLSPITSFDNYFETDDYEFVSTNKGLDELYIFNKITEELMVPDYNLSYADYAQYVYHVTEGKDDIYLLTSNVKSHQTYWYMLNKSTLKITGSKQLHRSASSPTDCAMDNDGVAYFVNSGVKSISVVPTIQKPYTIELVFLPDAVKYDNQTLYTYSSSDLFFTISAFDKDLKPLFTKNVNLPNQEATLIDIALEGNILYTATNDDLHPIYQNYITVYDLNSEKMIFCRSLKKMDELSLSQMIFE